MMNVLRSTLGFAREEILLGTVVLGGMGGLGTLAVHSTGMFTTHSQQALHMLEQVESANLKFYQEYGYWPHEVTGGSPTANVAVLQDISQASEVYLGKAKNARPLLDAALDTQDGREVVRATGTGGGIVRQAARDADSDFRYTITLDKMDMEDARKIDEKIDGTFDPEHGRVTITYVGDTAIVSYKANPRLSAIARLTD